jgi:hypothetical protein
VDLGAMGGKGLNNWIAYGVLELDQLFDASRRVFHYFKLYLFLLLN